ncbi:MAG: lipocalin-like domain-containing protein [Pseudomonadota bacterium]
MRLLCALLCVLASACLADDEPSQLAGLLGADDQAGFARAIDARRFVFPDDHGPHPEFRNEWWYVTGNLDDERGRRFGFELTIFRFSLQPGSDASSESWRTSQVYVAHFAVTDPEGQRFLVAEKSSRGAAGLAGATTAPFAVWLDDWSIAEDGDAWRLKATGEEMAIDVRLDALKAPVLNGDAGLSQKSSEPGNASYYYTISRLATDGSLRIGDEIFAVTGESWLDREWSTSALSGEQVGWDWFALQLSDGTELMFYSLRFKDGTQDPNSAGTFIAADGDARYLAAADVELDVTKTWDSPAGGLYPSAWKLTVPELGLELRIVPVMEDQELFTIVRYWEGAVDVVGKRFGEPVDGRGYVELTGYAEDTEEAAR